MIFQVYSGDSNTLIDNIDEAQVFDESYKIPKKNFNHWFDTRIQLENKVFTFANPDKDEQDDYWFRGIFLIKAGKTTMVYVQKDLACYILNNKGKTIQRVG